MGFTLQGFGPFLHWLTLGVLALAPVLAAIVDLQARQPARLDRPRQGASAGRCDQHLRLDGHHHDRAVADRDGLGASRPGPADRRSDAGRLQATPRCCEAPAGLPRDCRTSRHRLPKAAEQGSLAMLWALVSSAYVIYLYRKLKREAGAVRRRHHAGQLAEPRRDLDTARPAPRGAGGAAGRHREKETVR